MKLTLAVLSCTVLLPAAASADTKRITADDEVTYQHQGNIGDLRIVHMFLTSETVSDFAAIQGSGLSDKEIRHLKGIATSLARAEKQRNRLHFQKLCNEGARLLSSPGEFEAFYLQNSRQTQEAQLQDAMTAVASMSRTEYEWLQKDLAAITFSTTTLKDPNYVPDPEIAVQRACRSADAMG